jgi:hypothetical protein
MGKAVEIGVQRAVCKPAKPRVLFRAESEIHQQEGEIVKRVDPRKPVAEFNTVEDDRAVIHHRYIAEMEVAVIVPDMAGETPFFEKRLMAGDFRFAQPCGKRRFLRVKHAAQQGLQILPVLTHDALNTFCATKFLRDLCLPVERRNICREPFHRTDRKLALLCQCREKPVAFETLHLDNPVHHLALIPAEA